MNAVAHDIIVRPIITEKTSRMMELGQYTFEVLPKANKIEIRKAVEEVFKVKVVRVNTIQVRSKPKRMGAFLGRSRSWKKAIITLAKGEKIAFFEAQAPRQKGVNQRWVSRNFVPLHPAAATWLRLTIRR